MRNIIRIKVKIPHFLQETKSSISSLNELSNFASRFCVMVTYKKELSELPAIITLEEFLKLHFNLEKRMFIFIEEDIKNLFESKTLFLRNSEYSSQINLWKVNFNEIELNNKIKQKIQNDEYFGLSNEDKIKSLIILTPILPNRPIVIENNKSKFEKIDFIKDSIFSKIEEINSEIEYVRRTEDNLQINHRTEEIKEIELVDSFLTLIEKEHEFITDDKNELFSKNTRSERLISYIKSGFLDKEVISNQLKEQFDFKLDEAKNEKILNSPEIKIEFEQYDDYLKNIIKYDFGFSLNTTVVGNKIFLLKNYLYDFKLSDLDLVVPINGIIAQEIDEQFYQTFNLEIIENDALSNLLVNWLEKQTDFTQAQIKFIKENSNKFNLNLFLNNLSEIFSEKEIRDLVNYKKIEINIDSVKYLVKQNIFTFEELYLSFKWKYENTRIFENWAKEKTFFDLLELKDIFEKNKNKLTLKETEELFSKIKEIDISPITDNRIDNFIKSVIGVIQTKKMPPEIIIDSEALNLRREMEIFVNVNKNSNFSQTLENEYEKNQNFKIWKENYAFLSKIIHGKIKIKNEEDLNRFEKIKEEIEINKPNKLRGDEDDESYS